MPDRSAPVVSPGKRTIVDRFHNPVTAWLVLAVSLVITVAGWYIASAYAEARARDRFNHTVDSARVAIAKRMQEYENVLRGGVGLFVASDDVSRKDWHDYVATLKIDTYWPGIQGIGFSRMIRPENLRNHVEAVRAEGFPEYRVLPEGQRDMYSAIVYLEPFTGRNLRAFGFDMYAEPVRRAAMEMARDSGEPAVSGRVTLIQETSRDVQPGFLMYLPVYTPGMPTDTTEERRAAIAGFVYSPFRIRDLMQGILGSEAADLSFQLYDTDVRADDLLYDSLAGTVKARQTRIDPTFTATVPISLPGRTWTAVIASTAAFEEEMSSNQPAFVAIAGLIVDLLLFAMIMSLAQRHQAAVAGERRSTALLVEVEEANRFTRQLIEIASVMVVGLDKDGRVTLFNRMAESVSGFAAAEMLGHPWQERLVDSTDGPAFAQAIQSGREQEELVCGTVTRDGERRLIAWRMGAVPGEREVHTLLFGIDVTAETARSAELEQYRHHLEEAVAARTEELNNARLEAESANRAKSIFLANMSHELRTPMNAILGFTHLVQRDTRDMAQQERLERITTAANHLLAILNDILDISNIDAGRLHLESRNFRLDNVVFNAAALFSDKAAEKGLHFGFEMAPDLAEKYLGDAVRLQQVLANFCSNAVKFTDQGTISLLVRCEEKGLDHDLIRFEVRDSGIGVAPEILARLGETFSLGDASATRKYGGSGLGLAICCRLAKQMGGSVGGRRESEGGSTFWFTARLAKGSDAVAPSAVPPAALLSPTERDLRERHAGARILLAEDNAINQDVMRELLADVGLDLDVANDGRQAIAMAREQTYAIVLLDIQMPVTDGLTAAREIRALPGYPTVPILALTANAYPNDRDASFAAGMNAHLGKPVNPDELYGALLEWLDRTAMPSATGAE